MPVFTQALHPSCPIHLFFAAAWVKKPDTALLSLASLQKCSGGTNAPCGQDLRDSQSTPGPLQ
jgi:hypothetical protein